MRVSCPSCRADAGRGNPDCPVCVERAADEIHLAHTASGLVGHDCPKCHPAPAPNRGARRALAFRRRSP